MEQNNIIVIGGNHHNTLGVIRSLGYKGLRPYVILITNNNKPYICYSKYIKQYKCLSSPNEIVNYLLEIKDGFKSKPVVFSCADFVTAELDSHKTILDDYFHLPVGKGNIVQVMNKVTMSKIANNCGILTPKNILLKDVIFCNNRQN